MCERDDDTLHASKLAHYPSFQNYTFWYEQFRSDMYWKECNTTYTLLREEQEFTGLHASTAYRFKLRILDNATYALKTDWTDYKVLSTQVPEDRRKNQHPQIYVRGTGLNNHNSSII